jgi:hypothetical protein
MSAVDPEDDSAAHIASPRPCARRRTLRYPSSLSRNDIWSIGAPWVFSALGADPSSGIRNTADDARDSRREYWEVHT